MKPTGNVSAMRRCRYLWISCEIISFLSLMKDRVILICIFVVAFFDVCHSQETRVVLGDYTYYATESISIEEAKRTALERAKIQAIADAFGTQISQNSTTSIATRNNSSDMQFYMYGTTDIKGEWIETLNEPIYSISLESHFIVVNCKVKGKIREIIQPEIDLEAKTLKNGLTSKFESADFKDGDDLYISFKSSLSGNVVIYLLQGDLAYRLLPYKRSFKSEYNIIAGKEYIFFSKAFEKNNASIIDEYELFSDKDIDSACIVILYTPNEIGVTHTVEHLNDEPLSLDIRTFNKWLTKKRNRDKFSRVITLPLTIRK